MERLPFFFFFFFFFWRSPENFCEDLYFFFLESTCALCPWSWALASSIPVLGLVSVCPRKGCPWPWPRIFFCVLGLGLGLEPCVLDSLWFTHRFKLSNQITKPATIEEARNLVSSPNTSRNCGHTCMKYRS